MAGSDLLVILVLPPPSLVILCKFETLCSIQHNVLLFSTLPQRFGVLFCLFVFPTIIVEVQFHMYVLTDTGAAYFMLFHSIESFLGKLRESEEPQILIWCQKIQAAVALKCAWCVQGEGNSQLTGTYSSI